MEASDVAMLREIWAAECHAHAPKGACCCCYRSHHHQHQVRTEVAEADNERLAASLAEAQRQLAARATEDDEAARLRAALHGAVLALAPVVMVKSNEWTRCQACGGTWRGTWQDGQHGDHSPRCAMRVLAALAEPAARDGDRP